MPELETSTVEVDTTVADAAVIEQPNVETADTAAERDKGSLSEHEEQFKRPERRRAESDRATAEDVPRINKLTQRLRATERELEELKKTQTTAPQKETPRETLRVPTAPPAFDQKEPDINDPKFAEFADPYAAYVRALTKFDRDKEAHDAAVKDYETATQHVTAEADKTFERITVEHAARIDTFAKEHTDYWEVVKAAGDSPTSPVMQAAIMLDKQNAEYIYYLAKNPTVNDELFIQTASQPVNEITVASLQRLLRARVQAANTGSATSRQVVPPAPRLPKPVKTMPQNMTADTYDEDKSSISDHEKRFPQGRRQ